jgi:hypothetical protein
MASIMIKGNLNFGSGPWDEILYWAGINNNSFPLLPVEKESKVFQSGNVVMVSEKSWALLRYPFYKYRPSHNDVFHFDLWANGENLLMDSGTFSYNPDDEYKSLDYKSVHSHNTLSFDNQEQMPKLGRFLTGKWIKPSMVGDIQIISNKSGEWGGSYKHFTGNIHKRNISWNDNKWIIKDEFSGPARYIEVGFNFNICDYNVDHEINSLLLPWGSMEISTDAELQIMKHLVSRYYMHFTEVNRLVITTENNSELITTINIF